MKNRIYSPSCPLPPIKGFFEIEKLFPLAEDIHTLCDGGNNCATTFHCLRGEHGDENHDVTCSELWRRFDPLFCKMRNHIFWGAMGVITKKEKGNKGYFRYSWHIIGHANEDSLNPKLVRFFKKLNADDNSSKYLLLGKCAEASFIKATGNNDHSNIKCLLISDEHISTNISEGAEILNWLDIKRWDCEEPFDFHAELSADDAKIAWSNYISEAKPVSMEGSILYIPAVCYRETTPVLAGGVIWCVKPREINDAIMRIPEAQLYMRWMLSEIIKVCPNVGMAPTLGEAFVDRVNFMKNGDWGKNANSKISHADFSSDNKDAPNNKDTVAKHIFEGFRVTADDSCKECSSTDCPTKTNKCHLMQAQSAARDLLHDETRLSDSLSAWFLSQLLCVWIDKTKIMIDNSCDIEVKFIWKAFGGLSFLGNLIDFLDEAIQCEAQIWKINYRKSGDFHNLSFELNGTEIKNSNETPMDFIKLEACRAEGKNSGLTPFWHALCGKLHVCQEGNGVSGNSSNCSILYYGNKFTLSYRLDELVRGTGERT